MTSQVVPTRTRISGEKSLSILHKLLSLHHAHRSGFYGIEVADEVKPRVRKGFKPDGIPGHCLENYYRCVY